MLTGATHLAPQGQAASPPERRSLVTIRLWLDALGAGYPRASSVLAAGMQAREGICDAALPGRARDAASVRIRRCLPCGQRRCRAARRIFGVSRKETGPGAFCPSGYLAGAPGNGAVARFPAGDGVVHRPAGGTRPLPPFLPHHPRAALPPLFAANIRRFVKTGFPSPAKSQLFALPAAASFPKPSRRETGGLCPHPLKGPDP